MSDQAQRVLHLASTQEFLAEIGGMTLAAAAAHPATGTQLRLSGAVAKALRAAREHRELADPAIASAWFADHLAASDVPLHRRPWQVLSGADWATLEGGEVALPGAVIRQVIQTIRLLDDQSPGYTMMVRWQGETHRPDAPTAEDGLAALTADHGVRLGTSGELMRVPPETVLRCFDLDLLTRADNTGRRTTVMGGGTGILAIDAVVIEQIGPFLSPLSHAEIRDGSSVVHLEGAGERAALVSGPDPHLQRQRQILDPLPGRPPGTREAFDAALESALRQRIGDDERALGERRSQVEAALADPGIIPEGTRERLLNNVRACAPEIAGAQVDRSQLDAVMTGAVLPAVERYLPASSGRSTLPRQGISGQLAAPGDQNDRDLGR